MPRTTRQPQPARPSPRHSPLVRATAVFAVVATVLAGVLTFVGLATGGGDGDAPGGTVGLEPATSTTLGPADIVLASELPDGPLAGFTRAPLGNGPLDLDAAVEQFPFGDEEGQRLRSHGYVRGFSRAWQNAEREVLYLVVFEMADPVGFLGSWRAVAEPLADRRFETPVGEGMADVEGNAPSTSESEASFVAWADGTHWFYAVHFGPAGGEGADVIRAAVDATTSRGA